MTTSIIKPKRPADGSGWRRDEHWQRPAVGTFLLGFAVEAWEHPRAGLFVLSAVEVTATEPGAEDLGPEYHLSVSRRESAPSRTVRCSSADARQVLRDFGLEDATEDNHVPNGVVRNFWRPVADRLSGYECPCVDSEPAMREDRGDFVWRGTTDR